MSQASVVVECFRRQTAAERQERIADNLRAIDDAAAVGAEVLVLVCGPSPDRDITAASCDGRRWYRGDYTACRGGWCTAWHRAVAFPPFAGDRSVITTTREARLLAEKIDSAAVAVIVDVYHVWWDPERDAEITLLGDRIAGYHVNDWLVPARDVLLGRGMMGDGGDRVAADSRGLSIGRGTRGSSRWRSSMKPIWSMLSTS